MAAVRPLSGARCRRRLRFSDSERAVAECFRGVRVEPESFWIRRSPYPPAIAPRMMNGSRPQMIWSGNGVSGDELDRSSSQP
jgi:hypothetical protein